MWHQDARRTRLHLFVTIVQTRDYYSLAEGKGKKMKKRKGSQNQPAEVTSIADKESSNVHVNVTEQKTGEVLQRESQRPRPRSSQQRGKGGGRNVGPPNGPQTGYKQDESPAGESQNFRLSGRIFSCNLQVNDYVLCSA